MSLVAVLASLGVLLILHVVRTQRWRAKLPPGPKGYPLIGNLLGKSARHPKSTQLLIELMQ